ncbi:MAG: hypothetical protein MJ104_05605 [Lachnospiraceae bacterium]|nr:hypothetical protein [Lachnospiraceae bacterium]
MKKRIVAMLLSGMMGCAVLISGCSFADLTGDHEVVLQEEDEEDEDDADEDKDADSDSDNDEEDDADIVVEMSIDDQIALIADKKNDWLPKEDVNYFRSAAITDLDCDGRLEVVAAQSVNAAAIDVDFKIYEVDNAGTGLNEFDIEFDSSESMPDLLVSGIIQYATASADGEPIAYYMQDSLMYGYTAGQDRKFIMTFEDNKLVIEKIGYATRDYNNPSADVYYGRYDNVISEDDFYKAEDEYFKSKISGSYRYAYQSWDFVSIGADVSAKELSASYENYKRYSSMNEYYGSGEYTDDYPEGWVPAGFGGESRYSALGSLSMTNSDGGVLREFAWDAVEVHDSNNIYMYDYRDEVDRLDACWIMFSSGDEGSYNDGKGNYLRFTYSLYSTEMFTNIAIDFEDGTYAYAFTYDLYIDGEDYPRLCLVISFEDEEVYFVQSAGN